MMVHSTYEEFSITKCHSTFYLLLLSDIKKFYATVFNNDA